MRIVGVGVDVVEVGRIRRLLDESGKFRDRVFSDEEIALCEGAARPDECYAARWAAREACIKALGGTGGWSWRDVSILRNGDGAPRVVLDGRAKKRAEEIGVSELLVSLAHERSVAAAFCVALGEEPGGSE